ncbi:LSU ribosomal protein L11P [Herbihabitans rhizosphaerae]|uniref:Large ribosomal subunit protein uL11 n=1 Tax=Herbihabitans rhizosphaerae TaxID=1872711 RepID=A0A4Q7KK22_9PSEU|nr:50S ribosomal protein L11 [Herbihabitans rhizosphaerae]RZS36556.1 LSU ribosomal protein L11P [Herbihabitans rhizosphaerae]
MPPKQKKTFEVTLELEAGNAAMVDLGKMLGPTGVNTRAVKLEYDEATAAHRGEILPVVVSVYEDRSHSLRYKTPPTSFLIRQALGAKSGSQKPGHETAGKLTQDQVKAIAERKMPDLNATDVEGAMKIVAGCARSMGVQVG